jgi:hypothetical protein
MSQPLSCAGGVVGMVGMVAGPMASTATACKHHQRQRPCTAYAPGIPIILVGLHLYPIGMHGHAVVGHVGTLRWSGPSPDHP